MMTVIRQIKKEAYEKWIAADGQMRLDVKDHRGPFEGATKDTVHNHNGILYLAEFMILLKKLGGANESDRMHVLETLARLEFRPGEFLRHAHNTFMKQSHDNLVAIIALSTIFDTKHKNRLLEHGIKTGFKWSVPNEKGFPVFQPKDQALLKMSLGYRPTTFQLLWLCGSFLVNAIQSGSESSSHLMHWLRSEVIKHIDNDAWHFRLVRSFIFIWEMSLKNKGGLPAFIAKFFKSPGHPIIQLSNAINN